MIILSHIIYSVLENYNFLNLGEFWMSYNDFLRTYTHIEAVHLDADTARDEPSLIGKMPWVLRLYHGRWQKGVTAGGCRNNTGA